MADEAHWAEHVENADLKGVLSGFESQDKFFEAAGIKIEQPQDWRTGLPDDLKESATKFKTPAELVQSIRAKPSDWREGIPDDLKPVAERFTSREDAIRAIQAFQKRDGQVRVPGKDASDAEKAAYLKAIGVPGKPEEYEFPVLPKEELTDDIKANRQEWGKRFHELGVPKAMAKQLIDYVSQDGAKHMQAQVEADKQFAKAQEDALRAEWKGADFDKNHTLANRAFADLAQRNGLDVEALRKIETKDGRFLMDRAEIVRMFAGIGREMAEGTLGPTLTAAESETIDGQIQDVRKQIAEAQANGDSKRSNMLYQREQALIAKQKGNKLVVGAGGRSV